MPTEIRPEPPRQPDVEVLLRMSDDFALGLYPPESCYLLDVGELEKPGVTMFVARTDGRALGIAALVIPEAASYAELKRMFVHEDARGQGLARGLLASVEEAAAEAGIGELRLETGQLHHAAIALYERAGYERIPNFGDYVGGRHSICYAKPLAVSAR